MLGFSDERREKRGLSAILFGADKKGKVTIKQTGVRNLFFYRVIEQDVAQEMEGY